MMRFVENPVEAEAMDVDSESDTPEHVSEPVQDTEMNTGDVSDHSAREEQVENVITPEEQAQREADVKVQQHLRGIAELRREVKQQRHESEIWGTQMEAIEKDIEYNRELMHKSTDRMEAESRKLAIFKHDYVQYRNEYFDALDDLREDIKNKSVQKAKKDEHLRNLQSTLSQREAELYELKEQARIAAIKNIHQQINRRLSGHPVKQRTSQGVDTRAEAELEARAWKEAEAMYGRERLINAMPEEVDAPRLKVRGADDGTDDSEQEGAKSRTVTELIKGRVKWTRGFKCSWRMLEHLTYTEEIAKIISRDPEGQAMDEWVAINHVGHRLQALVNNQGSEANEYDETPYDESWHQEAQQLYQLAINNMTLMQRRELAQ